MSIIKMLPLLLLLLLPAAEAHAMNPCTQKTQLPDDTQVMNMSSSYGWELLSHHDYFSSNSSHASNLSCAWSITVPDEAPPFVLINIVNLDIEISTSSASKCKYDNLTIDYQLYQYHRESMKVYCGVKRDVYLLVNGTFELRFHTDYSVQKSGFHIRWIYINASQADEALFALRNTKEFSDFGCPVPLETNEQVLVELLRSYRSHSKFYKMTFDSNRANSLNKIGTDECIWSTSDFVRDSFVLFFIFDLKIYDNCAAKLKLIYTDYHNNTRETKDYSSNESPMVLSRGSVEFQFPRNCSAYFIAAFAGLDQTAARDVGARLEKRCEKIQLMEQSEMPSELAGFRGYKLTSHADYYSANNISYYINMFCKWDIQLPSSGEEVIVFKIVSLELEHSGLNGGPMNSIDQTRRKCKFDNLTIWYNDILSNDYRRMTFCSTVKDVQLVSTSNIRLQFMTDISVGYAGFLLEWYIIPKDRAFDLPGVLRSSDCSMPAPAISLNVTKVMDFYFALGSYQPNLHCVWNFSIGANRRLQIEITNLSLDVRDANHTDIPTKIWTSICSERHHDRLNLVFQNQNGHETSVALCGSSNSVIRLTAYGDRFFMYFDTDEFMQGRGFKLELTLKEYEDKRTHAVCPELKRSSRNREMFSISSPFLRFPPLRQCNWTIAPIDNRHFVSLTFKSYQVYNFAISRPRYRRLFPSEHRNNMCNLTVKFSTQKRIQRVFYALKSAMTTFTPKDFLPEANFTEYERSVCFPSAIMSASKVDLQLAINYQKSSSYYSTLAIGLIITNIPLVKSEADVCPSIAIKSILNRHEIVHNYIAVKQVEISGTGDCIANFIIEFSPHHLLFMELVKDRTSGNITCQHSDGKMKIFQSSNVTEVPCADGKFQLVEVAKSDPLVAQFTGTGKFSATIILWKRKKYAACPTYDSTKFGSKLLKLPLFNGSSANIGAAEPEFCYYNFSIPAGQELYAQILHSYSDLQLNVTCMALGRMPVLRPQLNLLSNAGGGMKSYSFCSDNGRVGELVSSKYIRIPGPASIEVELMSVHYSTSAMMPLSALFATLKYFATSITLLLRTHDTCSARTDWAALEHFDKTWHKQDKLPTKISLTSTITVPFNNTQILCYYEVQVRDAANELLRKYPIPLDEVPEDQLQWKMHVTVSELDPYCSYSSLTMIVQESPDDGNLTLREAWTVCDGSGNFSREENFQAGPDFLPNAEDKIGLYFENAPAGFVAKFQLTLCTDCIETLETSPQRQQETGKRGTVWIALSVVLLICNIAVILYMTRSLMASLCHRVAGRSRFLGHNEQSADVAFKCNSDDVQLIQ